MVFIIDSSDSKFGPNKYQWVRYSDWLGQRADALEATDLPLPGLLSLEIGFVGLLKILGKSLQLAKPFEPVPLPGFLLPQAVVAIDQLF